MALRNVHAEALNPDSTAVAAAADAGAVAVAAAAGAVAVVVAVAAAVLLVLVLLLVMEIHAAKHICKYEQQEPRLLASDPKLARCKDTFST